MLILLPLLAYKQYEWLGRVSESDREQMQASMRRSSSQFREDFDREITRVYESFQSEPAMAVRPEVLSEQLRTDYRALYANWEQTAPYPKLVSDLYLILQDSKGGSVVEHFNRSTAKFDEVDWPAELKGLRSAVKIVRFDGGGGIGQKVLALSAVPLDPKIPAVIFSYASYAGALNGVTDSVPLARVVVKLNLEFIEGEFIPTLARQYLAVGAAVPEYNVAVIDSSEPRRMIYSSNGMTSPNLNGDLTTAIFAARPGDFRGSLPRRMALAANDFFAKRDSSMTRGLFRMEVRRSTTNGSGPLTATTSVFETPENNPPWQLVVQHHTGSVDIAVGQARQRNLAISFSILLLLALSMALIVISSQRERRLARQQMEFVTTVSHELRTPLSVICSAGENLADGVVRDGEQTRQYGALVRNEGRRLTDMVEQILDFAGFQAGQKTTRMEPVDVAEVVDGALQTFEMQLHDSAISIEKHVERGLPQIMADSPALVRALQNLISNALKYGQAGNWLGIRAERSTDGVHIVVEDHGPGISPVDLPHIFEPFYRGRSAIDGQIKGSGLGLSLVKQIVESHHAKIIVSSDAASGSSFVIALPLSGSAANFVNSHDQAYSPR